MSTPPQRTTIARLRIDGQQRYQPLPQTLPFLSRHVAGHIRLEHIGRPHPIALITPVTVGQERGIAQEIHPPVLACHKLQGQVFHLIIYRRRHHRSLLAKRPSAPAGRQGEVGPTPAQALAAARPRRLEHHRPMPIGIGPTLVQGVQHLGLPSVGALQRPAAQQGGRCLPGSQPTVHIQPAVRRQVLPTDTQLQKRLADGTVPSPRRCLHLPAPYRADIGHRLGIQAEQKAHLRGVIHCFPVRNPYFSSRPGIPQGEQRQVARHVPHLHRSNVMAVVASQGQIRIRVKKMQLHTFYRFECKLTQIL